MFKWDREELALKKLLKVGVIAGILLAVLLLAACSAGGEVTVEIDPGVEAKGTETETDADAAGESQMEPTDEETQTDSQASGDEGTAGEVDTSAGTEGHLTAAAKGQVDINCTETNPHPVGQSIADTYPVTYEDVMTWFCSENSFDDILLAIETSQEANVAVDALLEMRQNGSSWDEIWNEVGVMEQ